MSHTVSIKTQFKDPVAIEAACKELGLPAPVAGTADLYQHKGVSGTIVRLPKWSFPVIIDTRTGEAKFDNYNGAWGKQSELDRFTQTYAVHKATIEARKKGFLVQRRPQSNGSIQLVVTGF